MRLISIGSSLGLAHTMFRQRSIAIDRRLTNVPNIRSLGLWSGDR
ncbi:hypothetical protein [Chamaesiphon sp.]